LVGAGFRFDAGTAPLLFDALPPLIHIPVTSDQAVVVLRAATDLLVHEMSAARPGATPMLDRLAQVVLHALRAYAATEATRPARQRWLVASLDPQIGASPRAMHDDIAHPWSVRELATLAGMSRSAFVPRSRRSSAPRRWSTCSACGCTPRRRCCGTPAVRSPRSPARRATDPRARSAPRSGA
jgi:uncharacterized protein (DUF2235 family)